MQKSNTRLFIFLRADFFLGTNLVEFHARTNPAFVPNRVLFVSPESRYRERRDRKRNKRKIRFVVSQYINDGINPYIVLYYSVVTQIRPVFFFCIFYGNKYENKRN